MMQTWCISPSMGWPVPMAAMTAHMATRLARPG